MKADSRFSFLDKSFWANVKFISQVVGYTDKNNNAIKVPTVNEIKLKYLERSLSYSHIEKNGAVTEYGKKILDYLSYRANVLNNTVRNDLMNAAEAEKMFEDLRQTLDTEVLEQIPLPMNKQKGDKKKFAFLTCIVNMLVASSLGKNFLNCDYDPHELTLLTKLKQPLRTLSRRVDGAYPSIVDPLIIWEIKEYYHTTTFGSRIADGVYETLVDGTELEEVFRNENRKVYHLLIVDAYLTWWEMGRSYLCRMIDMLNMGMVDEILFGKEVKKRIPEIFGKFNK